MSVSEIRNRTAGRAAQRWRRCVPLDPEACPDGRALTEYCEGRLSQGDKEWVTNHLLQCERCYFGVTESIRISHECVDQIRTPRRWVAQLAWAAALVLTTGVLVSLAVRHGPQPQVADRLLGASQSRLRTDLSGAELNRTPSDADDQGVSNAAASELSAALNRAASAAVEGASAGNAPPDPRTLRVKPVPVKVTPGPALGVAAVNQRAQNEIASAYLERWRKTQDLEDALAAFRAAKRALTDGPELLDARFNVASALEAMATSLQNETRKAWEQYLSADMTSDRSRHVKRRLDADTAHTIATIGRPGAGPRHEYETGSRGTKERR
jgi:hypothetical protein